ncbi:hypothetical protein [Streptosporangium roseum]|uniref:hypothetical protein n=1 Tax=Streptosporangium roseum TaxID=2001 RepID=UPI003327CA0B
MMATKKMLAGDYDFAAGKLKNVSDAIADVDVPSWGQVKTLVNSAVSNLDYKGSVRVASTANVSVSSAPATIDGVTLAAGNRILLKNQTAAAENGLYAFASAGAALTRAADADTGTEVTPGLWVTVEEGTANADSAWWLTTDGAITVGTTALTFTEFPLVTGGGSSDFEQVGPPATGTTWAITHNLGTKAIVAQVWEVATDEEIDVKKVATSGNVLTITAGVPLTQDAYRVVIFARGA